MTQLQVLLDYAEWAVANEPGFHYAQTRPMPLDAFKAKRLPITTDCSGFVTCCYYAAGLEDPNGGTAYDKTHRKGAGYTGTLMQNGDRVDLRSCKPGDLVIIGGGTGEHVAMVVQAGINPLLASHGQEAGPIYIKYTDEMKFHAGQPVQVRRYFDATPAALTWTVRAGDGTVIAKQVKRPALWSMSHWKAFRKYGKVTFDRNEVR